MKTLVVFSMAIVASQAFFLPNDFFTDLAHRMTDLHHAVRPQPQGQFSHRPHPPLIPLPEATNDATHQRMTDLFDSLSPQEQAALKNHLFGERFPRPLPASHGHGGHQKFSDEQVEAARDKWNSMTPEQQKVLLEKYQKPQSFRNSESSESSESSSSSSSSEEVRIRRPRSVQPIRHFPEAPVVRSAHHATEHKKVGEDKLQAIRERWEAMTPEEREAVKNGRRKHYKADEIPLARPQTQEKPLVRSPRSIQAPDFMPIRPFNVALNPESDYIAILEKMKGMTEEEQIKYIRELFPQGIPIRPLNQRIDPGYSRPLESIQPAAHQDEALVRPYLFPIAVRPLLPLDVQPIFPLPYFSDPEETNFLGPIPLPNRNAPEENEDDEDEDDEPKFMPY